jgi:hypothetical protein
MRLVLAVVLAGLVALPLSVSAQDAEEAATAEPSAEEPTPASEPAPEEPSLQLKLDDAGVAVTPTPPRTFNGYTLEELELRKRRAALGLIAPTALIVAGVPLWVVSGSGEEKCSPGWGARDVDHCRRLRTAGMTLTISGTVGMIVGLSLLGVRKRELERPYTTDRYALQVRVKRARRGLISTSVILGLGVALWVGGAVHDARNPPDAFSLEIPNGLIIAGLTLTMVGSVGMIVSGAMLGASKRKLRKLEQAHYEKPSRIQWDLARSRLVF